MVSRAAASNKMGSARAVRGSNDNAIPGEACVTDVGAPLPVSISDAELRILEPLILALARMASKRVSAATLPCDPEVRRCA